tara:strand:- start:575 stop:835 length:261 start_codon:yes stop_codon:yes gene_type:complete
VYSKHKEAALHFRCSALGFTTSLLSLFVFVSAALAKSLPYGIIFGLVSASAFMSSLSDFREFWRIRKSLLNLVSKDTNDIDDSDLD